jgi:predicted dehydrogenase
MDGLEHGLDVFVEKPMAISSSECETMIKTAAEHKRIIAVGQCVRAMREYAFLSETIHSGRLGELKFLKLNRMTGLPDWGNWKDPEFVKASGGALFDLLLHDVDYLRSCLGEPVSFSAASRFTAGGVSMISAGFDYPGVHVSVEGGFVMPSSFPFQRSFSAFFERGALNSSVPGKVEEFSEYGRKEYDFSSDDPYYTEMIRFVDAVRSRDCSGICTGEDAARTIECCRKIAGIANYPLPEVDEK